MMFLSKSAKVIKKDIVVLLFGISMLPCPLAPTEQEDHVLSSLLLRTLCYSKLD